VAVGVGVGVGVAVFSAVGVGVGVFSRSRGVLEAFGSGVSLPPSERPLSPPESSTKPSTAMRISPASPASRTAPLLPRPPRCAGGAGGGPSPPPSTGASGRVGSVAGRDGPIAPSSASTIAAADSQRSDGGNDTQEPKASSTPREREKTPTPTPKAEKTATPTPTPTATETPPPAPAEPDLARARQLQLQGYNARQAGDYNGALASSSQALKACGNAHALDPCGFALYEVGAALNGLGRYDEAIPYLERRLSEYGDNSSGEVQKALDEARGGGKPGKGKGRDKGPGKD